MFLIEMIYMGENSEPIFLIDSNILVYAYDITHPAKHEKAKILLEKCWRKQKKYAISSQNLAEFFVIITQKVPSPLSIEEAEQIIKDIASFPYWRIIHYDEQTIIKAIFYHKKTKKHFWDSLIAATMLQHGIVHICTENIGDFKNFSELQIVNPLV